MLAPISRFRNTKTYMYGSIAFVAGFAAVMALLVHYTPIRVADVATVTTPKAMQDSSKTSASTAEDTSDMTTPVADSSVVDMPASTATQDTPATDTSTTPPVDTTPTVPTDPVDSTTPTDPTVPTDPANPTDPTDPSNPTDPITDPLNPILPQLNSTSVDLSVSL